MENNDLLKKIPLFSCLNDEEFAHLTRVAIKKNFPKNTVLLSEGDITNSLYVIQSGKVKTLINDENGKEIILSIFGPGDYFGEMAFIDGEPRSASIETKEQTKLWIFLRNDLKGILVEEPDIVFNLLRGLIERLRDTNRKVESLAFMDVYGRVARLLVDSAKGVDGRQVVEEKLTHQEIANMIGSSREMVSRILKELINGGYISVAKKQITLNKALPYAF